MKRRPIARLPERCQATGGGFQESLGNPIEGVAIPRRYKTVGTYAAEVLTTVAHPVASRPRGRFSAVRKDTIDL